MARPRKPTDAPYESASYDALGMPFVSREPRILLCTPFDRPGLRYRGNPPLWQSRSDRPRQAGCLRH